jgi:hypothetical protein
MKKVIIPFDGVNFSKGAFEFASRLNQVEPILLAGLFLSLVDYANLGNYSGGAVAGPVYLPLVEDADAEVITNNIARFKASCEKSGIEYRVHEDYFDFTLTELKKESRFADLMVIGSEEFYKNTSIAGPNTFLKDAMHDSECPVVIVPEEFPFPESVVLAYDGSESSVFAIKQFAYLFPDLTGLPTLLVTADTKRPEKGFPEQSNIEELAARHFSQLTFMKLEFDARKYFSSWMMERKSCILVCGAFERSTFSEAIKKSFVSEVIAAHQLPVFMAHR